MNFIPVEVKKKCVEMSKSGITYREIYTEYYSKLYDTKFTGFQSMLKRWKKKALADDELLEKGNLSYNFKPHATTVQLNKDGEVTQSWIKSKSEDNLYIELIENIKNLPEIKLNTTEIPNADNYMLEIPLYDMHWGINDYEHYKKTLKDTLDIISRKNYEEINIIIGQDLFHNDDFKGRTSKGTEIEKVDMVQAWNEAREFYYNIMNISINHSEKVKVIYSKGNHDESMSWAFIQMIKAKYGNHIKVDDDLKDRKLISYGTNFIGITHGDKIKGKPINLRSIYTIEYPVEFSKSKVREIHAGHLHHEKQEDTYGVMCRSLSSGNRTDEWHYENGFVGQHKRFTIFEWSREKLASIHYV